MKRVILLLSLSIVLLLSCSKTEYYIVKLDKTTYNPGEAIHVNFVADTAWDSKAWIGIIPAEVPHGKESDADEKDIDYKYIEKKEKGIMEFSAPTIPGKYNIRMHDSDDPKIGKEKAFAVFDVK